MILTLIYIGSAAVAGTTLFVCGCFAIIKSIQAGEEER